jgi:hypothetical protein
MAEPDEVVAEALPAEAAERSDAAEPEGAVPDAPAEPAVEDTTPF